MKERRKEKHVCLIVDALHLKRCRISWCTFISPPHLTSLHVAFCSWKEVSLQRFPAAHAVLYRPLLVTTLGTGDFWALLLAYSLCVCSSCCGAGVVGQRVWQAAFWAPVIDMP